MKSAQPSWEDNLDAGYRELAQDEAREFEALELAEATIGDASEERAARIDFDQPVEGEAKTRPPGHP